MVPFTNTIGLATLTNTLTACEQIMDLLEARPIQDDLATLYFMLRHSTEEGTPDEQRKYQKKLLRYIELLEMVKPLWKLSHRHINVFD